MEKTSNRVVRFPPKKILAALDLSEASLPAWEEAKQLAKEFGAKVEGIYVQPWIYSGLKAGMPSSTATARASSEALEALRARLGLSADVGVVPGEVEETILSWGKDLGFDLIVMGTHGRTGFQRAIQGSVAETIVYHSVIPVLIVRGRPAPIKSVLVPVNFESYAMAGLQAAGYVAQAFKARLTALHVLDAALADDLDAIKEAKSRLAAALARLAPPVRRAARPAMRLGFGRADEQIVSAGEDSDLIVMAAHRKGFLNDTVLGTTVERVMRHSTKPVLAIPPGLAARRPENGLPARLHHQKAALAR